MQSTYKPFIDRMIHQYEGGYGWNHKDPGGPTNFGITCYDLAEHRGQRMTSMDAWVDAVRTMPLSEAEDIYAKKYAGNLHYAELPVGVDCVLLDYGVNSGDARSLRVARAVLGLSGSTMDQAFLDAIKLVNEHVFIDKICDERLRFMHAIRGGEAWAEFGHGWGARVADLRTYAHQVVNGSQSAPGPDLGKVVTPKATNVGTSAPKTTTAGTVASGTSAYMAGLKWWAVGGVIVAGIAAGLGYELWSDHKAKVANATVHL